MKKSNDTVVMNVRFPFELRQKITEESTKTGTSQSAIIRNAVAEHFNEKPRSNLSNDSELLLLG
jgi:predicted DNA-binding protein